MRKPDKPKIRISVTTRVDTTQWSFGKQVLEALYETDERLLPERIGHSEPIKIPFESIEACEKHWAPAGVIKGPEGTFDVKWNVFWKRTKPIKNLGCMFHTSVNKFGDLNPGWLTISAVPDKKADWIGLFRRLCTVAPPQFSTLHLFTHTETWPGAFTPENDENYDTNDYQVGAPPIALKERGIPNLSWANFFGEEYAAEVDPQKLRDHGFGVEEIGQGFLVTVTPRLLDVMDNFALFSAKRVELKKLFRPGLFRIANEPILPPA
jgi:hypothetical protein